MKASLTNSKQKVFYTSNPFLITLRHIIFSYLKSHAYEMKLLVQKMTELLQSIIINSLALTVAAFKFKYQDMINKGSLQKKKKCNIFYIWGGGQDQSSLHFFFSKTWSKMA